MRTGLGRYARIAPASSSWVPTDVAGLVGWWDASDTATITQSGGLVSQWNDKSGNGHHLTQGTGAKQPTTGTRTLNGLNVLDFDGGDHINEASGISQAQPFTVLVVARYDTAAADGRLICTGNFANVQAGDASPAGRFMFAGSIFFGGSAENTSAHYYTYKFNGASSTLRVDGAVDGSGDAGSASLEGINIGSRISGGSPDLYLDGIVAEVVVAANMSDGDRNSCEAYFAAKWGL